MGFPALSDQSRQNFDSIQVIVGNSSLVGVTSDFDTPGVLFSQTSFEIVGAAQPGTCSIMVRDPHQVLSFTSGDLIQLVIDGENVWRGLLLRKSMGFFTMAGDGLSPSETKVRSWLLQGVDLNIVLDKLYVYNRVNPALQAHGNKPWPPGTMDRSIILDVWKNDCDVDKLPFKINAVSKISEVGQAIFGSQQDGGGIIPFGPGGTLRGFMEQIGESVFRSTPGAVIFYIDGDGFLVYRGQDSDIAPFSVSDNGSMDVACSGLEITEDISTIKNDVLVFANTLNPDVTAKVKPFLNFTHGFNQPSINAHGRWQYAEIDPYWSQAWLNARSSKLLTQEGTPAQKATFTVYRPGLYPGQIMTVASDAFGIVEDLPVRQIELTFPAPGIAAYGVTASFDTNDPWGLLLALRRPTQRGFIEPRFQTFDPSQFDPSTMPSVQTFTSITEVPRHKTGFTYQLSKAYISNSLAVYVEGLFMVQGVDYSESSPDGGQFRFLHAPLGTHIYVSYHVATNLTTAQIS